MRSRTMILTTLLILLSSVAGWGSPGDDVATLAAAGRIDALAAGLEGGLWNGTDGEILANAVTETDGLASLQLFEEVAGDDAAGPKARTYAWYQIWGYSQLTGDRSKINDALKGMQTDRTFAQNLYGGPLPEPEPDNVWAVQIGAFGSREIGRSSASP